MTGFFFTMTAESCMIVDEPLYVQLIVSHFDFDGALCTIDINFFSRSAKM